MIEVYIWNSRLKDGVWGHAAMRVQWTHISWWPTGEGRIPRFAKAAQSSSKVVQRTVGSIYAAHPIRNQSFEDDQYLEGIDEQGNFRGPKPPDHTVTLEGLDEEAILDWWQGFGLTRNGTQFAGPLPAWHTTETNCSTVVARGLTIGGGEAYAGWWPSHNVVWTPNDVLRYALAIREGLARQWTVAFEHHGKVPELTSATKGTDGLYESTVTVFGKETHTFRGSIYPNDMNEKGRIKDGTYDLYLGFHKRERKPAKGDLEVRTNGLRPALIVNADKPVPVISNKASKVTSEAIHVHNGFKSKRESEGCPTIHPSDWEGFIKVFLQAFPNFNAWVSLNGYVGKKIGLLRVRA